jgi:hypothetical protein
MRALSFVVPFAALACQSPNWGGPSAPATAPTSLAPPPPVATADNNAATTADPPSTVPTPAPAPTAPTGAGRVIGVDGIAAFDALTAADKSALKSTKIVFFHASVGGNILDGATALGFPFAKVASARDLASASLGEHDYGEHNGKPFEKLDAFTAFMSGAKDAKLAGAKLCWTDFDHYTDLGKLEAAYARAVASVHASAPSTRVFHVGPPLMSAKASKDNPLRIDYTAWLKSTFAAREIVLDLPAIQSTDAKGQPCTDGKTRVMCDAYASDEGHLNDAGATRAAKAFLYALHVARTR